MKKRSKNIGQNNDDRSQSENNVDAREKSLADITALALGQTENDESSKVQSLLDADAEAKQWFDEVDSIANLVKKSSNVGLPERSAELRAILERELDGSADANSSGKDSSGNDSVGKKVGVALKDDKSIAASGSVRGVGTKRLLSWLAATAACVVIGCFAWASIVNSPNRNVASGNADRSPSDESLTPNANVAVLGQTKNDRADSDSAANPEPNEKIVNGIYKQKKSLDELDQVQKFELAVSPDAEKDQSSQDSVQEEIFDVDEKLADQLSEFKQGSTQYYSGATLESQDRSVDQANIEQPKFYGELSGGVSDGPNAVEGPKNSNQNLPGIDFGGGGSAQINGGGGAGGGGFSGETTSKGFDVGDGESEYRMRQRFGRSADPDKPGVGMGGLFDSEESDAYGWYEDGTRRGEKLYAKRELSESESTYNYESRGRRFGLDDEDVQRFKSRQLDDEQYQQLPENHFIRPILNNAKSTFAIDVDTASYSNIRRMINAGRRPLPAAVRIEEMVNYFSYDYQTPEESDQPFAVNMELAECPWNERHQLLRIGIKGKEIHREERPNSNLVFLVDVSGSMSDRNKLPLLKSGLHMMLDRLGESDRISIVTYSGNAGIALEPTSGDQKERIRTAIDQLSSGGSTNGSAGIEMAYKLAERNFINEGVNRVILATDGDLNVGVTDDNSLVQMIKEKAKSNVFLSVFGFGTGNLKDAKLEKIADNGNGVYAYIDSTREAHRVLVEQMSGTLITIAKNVKLQLEFNPAEVEAYRLIGYENRVMANADFDNDKKDGGDIGAGHTVTALYEIVPAGTSNSTAQQSAEDLDLKYQQPKEVETSESVSADEFELRDAAGTGDLLTLSLKYMEPESNESEAEQKFTIPAGPKSFDAASSDFQFAASVASFGLILRKSRYRGDSSLREVEKIAVRNLGDDASGYRAEFVDLVRKVKGR